MFSYTKVKEINIGSATDKLEAETTPLASPSSPQGRTNTFGTQRTKSLPASATVASAPAASAGSTATSTATSAAATQSASAPQSKSIFGTSRTNALSNSANTANASSTPSTTSSSNIFGTTRTKGVADSATVADAPPAPLTKTMNGITWTYTWDATNSLGTFSATITGGAYKNTYPKQTKDDQDTTSSIFGTTSRTKSLPASANTAEAVSAPAGRITSHSTTTPKKAA